MISFPTSTKTDFSPPTEIAKPFKFDSEFRQIAMPEEWKQQQQKHVFVRLIGRENKNPTWNISTFEQVYKKWISIKLLRISLSYAWLIDPKKLIHFLWFYRIIFCSLTRLVDRITDSKPFYCQLILSHMCCLNICRMNYGNICFFIFSLSVFGFFGSFIRVPLAATTA